MFVLVENDSITKTLNTSRGITIGENQYPRAIYTSWSPAEREAIGIYEVVFDNTNFKDQKYYTNTNQSLAFAGGVATASYGSATANSLADTLFTAQDEVDGLGTEGEVKAQGLKSQHKEKIKQQASSLLATYDWYVIRKADAGTAVPSAITTYRAAVRTKSGEMETLINNAANVDALATLYEYVNTGTEENPVMERPLGEFPEAV